VPTLGSTELIILLVVVLVLFGAKRLPDSARSIGRSMRILKAETKGMREDDADGADRPATTVTAQPLPPPPAASYPPAPPAAGYPPAPPAAGYPPAPPAAGYPPAPPAASYPPAPPAASYPPAPPAAQPPSPAGQANDQPQPPRP